MAEFNLDQEYLDLIRIVSAKNGIDDDEVVETAIVYFLRMYFMQMDMYPELDRVNKAFVKETMDPEEIRKKLEEEKNAVDTAIAEARRQGYLE